MRTLNAVRGELASLGAEAPGYLIRALKREELMAMGSVVLHELYCGNLGRDGKIPDAARAMLEEHFGSVAAWRLDRRPLRRGGGGGGHRVNAGHASGPVRVVTLIDGVAVRESDGASE